jgi:hypothetical protein
MQHIKFMGIFGSNSAQKFESKRAVTKSGATSNIFRVIDVEAGVVVYGHTKKDGLTSIPISETELEVDEFDKIDEDNSVQDDIKED